MPTLRAFGGQVRVAIEQEAGPASDLHLAFGGVRRRRGRSRSRPAAERVPSSLMMPKFSMPAATSRLTLPAPVLNWRTPRGSMRSFWQAAFLSIGDGVELADDDVVVRGGDLVARRQVAASDQGPPPAPLVEISAGTGRKRQRDKNERGENEIPNTVTSTPLPFGERGRG